MEHHKKSKSPRARARSNDDVAKGESKSATQTGQGQEQEAGEFLKPPPPTLTKGGAKGKSVADDGEGDAPPMLAKGGVKGYGKYAFMKGYGKGGDEFYGLGRAEGKAEGRAEGFADGYVQGKDKAYTEGFDDGHDAGVRACKLAIKKGWTTVTVDGDDDADWSDILYTFDFHTIRPVNGW